MLDVKNLHASVGGQPTLPAILRGVDLSVGAGEVHILMGSNGSGKSTLLSVLMGREPFEVTDGEVLLGGQDLLSLPIEERARAGLFLSLQEPVELPGVQVSQFLLECERALALPVAVATDSSQGAAGKPDGDHVPRMDPLASVRRARKVAENVGLMSDVLKRDVHVGFSGGEKKRFEMLQMALFAPRCILLDEIDSGLDVDAFKLFAKQIETLRSPDYCFLLVTHYQRLTEWLQADRVHVMDQGRVVASGGPELGRKIEQDGYGAFAHA